MVVSSSSSPKPKRPKPNSSSSSCKRISAKPKYSKPPASNLQIPTSTSPPPQTTGNKPPTDEFDVFRFKLEDEDRPSRWIKPSDPTHDATIDEIIALLTIPPVYNEDSGHYSDKFNQATPVYKDDSPGYDSRRFIDKIRQAVATSSPPPYSSKYLFTDEPSKVDGKRKLTESLLERKNLEIKKINDEKKAAMAAQFAAEATLRRVHAALKDDDMPPVEAIRAPLEAELKLARQKIAKLQDDNKALDRLTKSKEAALLEAEKTVQVALVKASMVDDLQNKNQELMKQIEICQEENKILDKMHRRKVAEVEKLTQIVRELQEHDNIAKRGGLTRSTQ